MKPSKVLVAALAGIICGVGIGSFGWFSWSLVWGTVLAGCVLLVWAGTFRAPVWGLGGIFLIFLAFGFIRASLAPLAPPDSSLNVFSSARQALIDRASLVMPGDEHAVFSAMVLGDESLIPFELKESFNITGTRHILAISGMNLTIVSILIWKILIGVGLWRRQAFYGALIGIFLFVLLVGSPPSAVRAGVMAGVYLLAQNIGRPADGWRVLVCAAALMILFNPSLLVFGVGFQLSFCAVAGMFFFKNYFDSLFSRIPIVAVRDLVSMSCAAQITTWPLIAFYFGTVSFSSLAANLVIVPLMPLVMIAGLGFVLVGWVHTLAGSFFLWPLSVILRFVIFVAEKMALWPHASIELSTFAIPTLVLYYVALLSIVIVFRRNVSVPPI